MASIENITSRDKSESEQTRVEQKRLKETQDKKPPETTQDLRSKEVFRIALPAIKDAL